MKPKSLKIQPETGRVPSAAVSASASASEEQVRAMIAEAAYYRAEKRGFSPGMEIEDWIAAEADVRSRALGRNQAN